MPSKPAFNATLILFSYNQATFVGSAAQACLAQVGQSLEIIFSDDASSDETFEILTSIFKSYNGPHTVILRQNAMNMGIGAHYNEVVKIARGELLITAAGDDISVPHRAERLIAEWRAKGKPPLVASDFIPMSSAGEPAEALVRVADLSKWATPEAWCRKRPHVVGATHAFTKQLWDVFGPLSHDLHYEDQVMTFRASCLGGGVTVREPLVLYRDGGISSQAPRDGVPGEQLGSIKTRFLRQRAVFAQVREDLKTIQRMDLWRGRVRRYLLRAEAALYLVGAREAGSISWSSLWQHACSAGLVWTVRYLYRIWK